MLKNKFPQFSISRGLFVASLLLLSSKAFAQSYTCHAQANPDRGFPVAFDVSLSSDSIGGTLTLTVDGETEIQGQLDQIQVFDRETNKDAFDFFLGILAPQDVSGLTLEQLAQVTRIDVFQVLSADLSISRIYAGKTQLGGTFLGSGLGTSCLPQ